MLRPKFYIAAMMLIAITAAVSGTETKHLYNGDFEISGKDGFCDGWKVYKSSPYCSAEMDKVNFFSGKSSLRVEKNDFNSSIVVEQHADKLTGVSSDKEYILTFRYKLESIDKGYIHPYLIGTDSKGNNIAWQFFRSPAMQRVDRNMKDAVNIFDIPTQNWQEVYIKFRPPKNVAKVKFHLEGSCGKFRLNIDDIRIRENTAAADRTVFRADFANVDKMVVRRSKNISFSGSEKGFSHSVVSGNKLKLTYTGKSSGSVTVGITELLPLSEYKLLLDYSAKADGGKLLTKIRFRRSSGQLLSEITRDIAVDKKHLEIPFQLPEACGIVELCFGGENIDGFLEIARATVKSDYNINADAGIYNSRWQGYKIWDVLPNGNLAEGKTRYFRRTFQLDAPVKEARIRMFGHNRVNLNVNGKFYGGASYFTPVTYDIADSLKPGKNVIAIQGVNTTGGAKVAFNFYWSDINGKSGFICSDKTVKVFDTVPENWNTAEFDDSSWRNAVEIGDSSESDFRNGKNYIGPRHTFALDDIKFERKFFNDRPFTVELTGKFTEKHDIKPFEANDTVGKLLFTRGEMRFDCNLPGSVIKVENGKLTVNASTMYLPEGEFDLTLCLDEYKFTSNGTDILLQKIDLGKVHCAGFAMPVSKPVAKIVDIKGKKTIAVNGKPISPVNYLLYFPDFTDIPKLNRNNIKIHQFAIDSYGAATPHGDRIRTPEGKFDFSGTDKLIYDAMQLLKDDPESYFFITIPVGMPIGWGEDMQDHVVTTSHGNKLYVTNGRYCIAYKDLKTLKRTPNGFFAPSAASPVYRQMMIEYTRKVISHLENTPFAQRIIGYGLTAAFDGQWLSWELEGGYMRRDGMGDYSPVMLEAFRKDLQVKYNNDVKQLQKAWGNPSVTFDTAKIPDYDMRTKFFVNRQVADYNETYYRCTFNILRDVTRAVKESSGNRALVWTYKPESASLTYSFGTQKTVTGMGPEVYGLESLDIFANPVDYYTRQLGVPTVHGSLTNSLSMRNKLCREELDLRTYLTGDMRLFLTPHTLKGTEEYFKKNAIQLYMAGSTNHYYEFYPGWFNNSGLLDTMGKLAAINFDTIKRGARWKNQVCFLFCAGSNLYLGNFDGAGERWTFFKYLAELRRFRSSVMGRLGTGYDEYYLEDILSEKFPAGQYKVYIVYEAYHIPADIRKAIENKLKKNNSTIIWFWGSGFLDKNSTLSGKSIEQVTGFKVKQLKNDKMPRQIHVGVSKHPFLKGIRNTIFGQREMNNCHPDIPVFSVDDPQAVVLGKFPDGSAALAVKKNAGHTAVYCALHRLPPEFLRNIFMAAGVHIFVNNNFDYVYTDGNYLAVHSRNGGRKTVRLPEKAAQVYDVFREKVVAENSDVITVEADDDETVVLKLSY
ncbi:MAG: hypothetical protein E7057_03905 [Lentisphaerae bacterium]|nr:hypothetical protein [Lentisphaerota bacterium]